MSNKHYNNKKGPKTKPIQKGTVVIEKGKIKVVPKKGVRRDKQGRLIYSI